MLPVEQPFKTYTDLDGKPLQNGFVYFGLPSQDPTTAPVTVYWDAAGTIPAAQPLRTMNGYILRAGTPANVFFDGAYSELVLDSRRRQVFYARTSAEFSIAYAITTFLANIAASAGASLMGFIQAGIGAVKRTVEDELRETLKVTQFGAKGNGVTDDTAAFQAALDCAALDGSPKEVFIPTGRYVVGQLKIPYGVTLTGPRVARRGMPGNWINAGADGVVRTGADLVTDAGKGSTDHKDAFIFMHPQARVSNVNVWYAGQTREDDPTKIVVYAPTFAITSSEDGNSDNCVIDNISALNCYEFLRIGDGVNSVGRPIATDCFVNPFGPVGVTCRTMNGDVGMLQRVFVENLFSINPVDRPNLYEYQRQNLVAFDLGYSQGVNLTDCIALSCKHGVKTTSQTWAQIANCLFDYCQTPLLAEGADRVFFSTCSFLKNYGPGACLDISSNINHLSFTNCMIGDPYSAQKTGAFHRHVGGTVKYAACTFTMSAPAVLNAGRGAVQMSTCGIGYDRVVGENISIDGGPALVAGSSLGLVNVNPTSPAAAGWSYATPGNVTAITDGIRIQGAGNNTLNFRPADVSADNNNKIFFGTQLYCLQFQMKVVGQSGSPKLELIVLDNNLLVAAEAFQVSQDSSGADSGLPEGETFQVSVILPWAGTATQLRFNLPGQVATTIYEITKMDIKQVALPRGFTGLEWFGGKTKLPLGYYDPQTGGKVWQFPAIPSAGTWSVGDRTINLVPAVGVPKAWTCVTAGTPGVWASEGTLA